MPSMCYATLNRLNQTWQQRKINYPQVKPKGTPVGRFSMFGPDTFKKTGCGCGK